MIILFSHFFNALVAAMVLYELESFVGSTHISFNTNGLLHHSLGISLALFSAHIRLLPT